MSVPYAILNKNIKSNNRLFRNPVPTYIEIKKAVTRSRSSRSRGGEAGGVPVFFVNEINSLRTAPRPTATRAHPPPRRLGFARLREVGNDLKSIPDRVVWGGDGTIMEIEVSRVRIK